MSRVNAELFWRTCGDIYRRIFSSAAQRPVEAWWQIASELLSDVLVRIKEAKAERSVFLTNWDQYWGMQRLVITEADVLYDVRVIGARQVQQVWYLLVRSKQDLPAGPSLIRWANGQRQTWALPARLDKDLWVVRLLEAPVGQLGGSVYFGTSSYLDAFQFVGSRPMTLTEQGARFFVEGFNVSHAAGLQSLSPETRFVEVAWVVQSYSKPLDASRMHLMLALVGTRQAVAVQLRDELGLRLELVQGAQVTPLVSTGSLTWVKQRLEAASPAQPVRIVMRAVWDVGLEKLRVSVRVDSVEASSSDVFWEAQNFRAALNVTHQLGVVVGYVEYVDIDVLSPQATLSLTPERRYQVDPPIHACERLMVEPVRLGVLGELVLVEPNSVVIELADEEDDPALWASLVQGSSVYQAKLSARQADRVIYELLDSQASPSVGLVLIEPMYLTPDQYRFSDPGVLLVNQPLELTPTWYARASRARGTNLWSKFGLLLGMQRFEDSERTLQWLRGLWLGIHARPTARHMEAAIAAILGVGVVTKPGSILAYELVADRLGAPSHFIMETSAQEFIRIPFRLANNLYPIGYELEAWEQPVRAVRVYDRLMDQASFDALLPSAWGAAHRFIVSIPDQLGVSVEAFEIILDMLDRSKPTWTQGVLEVRADSPLEWLGNTLLDLVMTLERPSPVEDMIFSDWVEAIDDPELVNADEQTVGAPIMQGRQLGFDGLALGVDQASFLKQTLSRVGVILGENYPTEQLVAIRELVRPWLAVSLKLGLTSEEVAQGLSRPQMRIASTWQPRATSMVRVLDDVGGPISYTQASWIAGGASPEPQLNAVWFSSPFDMLAAGDNSSLLRSTNYGTTWTNLGVVASAPFRGVWQNYAVTTNGVWIRTGPTSFVPSPFMFSHLYNCIHAEGARIVVGGEDTNVFTGLVAVSTDNGVSFSEITLSGSFSIVVGIRVFGSIIYAATNDGAFVSFDLGASWTQTNAFQAISSVELNLEANQVIFGDSQGRIASRPLSSTAPLVFTALDPSYVFSTHAVVSISFAGRIGVIAIANGDVWQTRDAGATWSRTILGGNLTAVHVASDRYRALVGLNQNFRWRA